MIAGASEGHPGSSVVRRWFRVSSALGSTLEQLGVHPHEVLSCAGLPTALFDQERILLTTEELFALYRGLSQAARDPAIGLQLGSDNRIEPYEPIHIIAASAHSFREALDRVGRYEELTCPAQLVVRHRGDESRIQLRWLLARGPEPHLLVDMAFSRLSAIARRGTGGRVRPRRVDLRAKVERPSLYEEYFGCPVRLGARRNILAFAREDLDRPFVAGGAERVAALAPGFAAELLSVDEPDAIGARVKGAVKLLFPGRTPDIKEVARTLALSSRTLQRRLAGSGLTFQQVVGEARQELARHYLLHSSLELTETAYLLGYEDSPAFFSAFQQWEGSPPGAWRNRHSRAWQRRPVRHSGAAEPARA